MKFESLQQRVLRRTSFRHGQRRPIDDEATILRRNRRRFRLEQRRQRAKLRLLFLLRGRIAKQVQCAREEEREFLRTGHGDGQFNTLPVSRRRD